MPKKLTYDYIKNEIENVKHVGSKLLSKEYINNEEKLNIICEHGHEFEVNWRCIDSQKQWCSKCSGNYHWSFDEICKKITTKHKGSKVLSTAKDYKNCDSKLNLICKNGHKFKMCWGNIQQGQSCPHCHHKTEQKVREIFEKLTGKEFKSTYSILKVPKEYNIKRLQLDGYNEELNIGWEYNGEQHYKNTYFNINKPHILKEIQKRDKLKAELCNEQGIKLIVIPYWEQNNLKNYIRNVL